MTTQPIALRGQLVDISVPADSVTIQTDLAGQALVAYAHVVVIDAETFDGSGTLIPTMPVDALFAAEAEGLTVEFFANGRWMAASKAELTDYLEGWAAPRWLRIAARVVAS